MGAVLLLQVENLPAGPLVVTPWACADAGLGLGCPLCREWSEVPKEALGKEIGCPKCGKRLKLNPFTINADWRPIAKAWRGPSRG